MARKNTKKKQAVRRSAKKVAKKTTKKSTRVPVKKTAKKASKKSSKKPVKKTVKKPTKKIIKKTVKKSTKKLLTKKAASKSTKNKIAKRKIGPKTVKKAVSKKVTKKLTISKTTNKRMNTKKTPTKGANKKSSSNVLGRGLSALMSANSVQVDVKPKQYKSYAASVPSPEALQKSISREQAYSLNQEQNTNGLMFLNVNEIKANPNQPRKEFSHQDLQELSDSIKKSGLLQPILVTKKEEGGYEIVAGERRFRASQLAGITEIPALIKELTEREILELSIVENVQRTDLNPVEEALAYQRLADEFSATQEEIAKAVGKNRSTIANTIRLLKLDPKIQLMLKSGKISSGHARALLMAGDEAFELAEQIITNKMSVREAENKASDRKAGKAEKLISIDPITAELENRLRRALGTKVTLSKKKNGNGEVKISFFSNEELNSIVEKIEA